jgi:xanthine/CO dehydrogenase XdhC/CoxF family maturation factor
VSSRWGGGGESRGSEQGSKMRRAERLMVVMRELRGTLGGHLYGADYMVRVAKRIYGGRHTDEELYVAAVEAYWEVWR